MCLTTSTNYTSRTVCAWQRPTTTYPAQYVPDNVHQLHIQHSMCLTTSTNYTSSTVCAWQRPPTTPTTCHVWKTRGCQCSFRILMMGDVATETCWASCRYGIIKLYILLHLVGIYFMNSQKLSPTFRFAIFLYTFLCSPVCATCPSHPIILQIIILISGNEYRLRDLLCSVYRLTLTHWGRGHLNCLNARSRGF